MHAVNGWFCLVGVRLLALTLCMDGQHERHLIDKITLGDKASTTTNTTLALFSLLHPRPCYTCDLGGGIFFGLSVGPLRVGSPSDSLVLWFVSFCRLKSESWSFPLWAASCRWHPVHSVTVTQTVGLTDSTRCYFVIVNTRQWMILCSSHLALCVNSSIHYWAHLGIFPCF